MYRSISRVLPTVFNHVKVNSLSPPFQKCLLGVAQKVPQHLFYNGSRNMGSSSTPNLADKELATFLKEEIENETKSLQSKGPISPPFEGFKTEFENAKVILHKKVGNENIKVIFNVNDSLDSGASEDYIAPRKDEQSEGRVMPESSTPVSKPTYTIEIEKNGRILAFYCSFVENEDIEEGSHLSPEESSYNDLFRIDEISHYKNEYSDDSYAVSCDLLDEQMYEKLFNMLEDRGLGNEFASKLTEFSTIYEHKLYVDLLTKIKSFISS